MIKKIIKTLAITLLLFSLCFSNSNADDYKGLDVGDINGTATRVNSRDNLGGAANTGDNKVVNNNSALTGFKDSKHYGANANEGERGIENFILKIALSVKNIFLAITGIYFLIIVLRQLMSENAEEEFEKFKKGIRWITAGIIIMQISYNFVETIYNKEIDGKLAGALTHNIIQPMINLLQYAASFMFIAIAIFAYYSLVTNNGEEEKAKKAKLSVAYAVVGFVIIQLSKFLVSGVYGKILCTDNDISCNAKEIKETAGIMFDVIKWVNNFVGIIIVIMIIYTGVQIIFSNGEDEKIKKAKKSLLYIFIGIIILTMNYIILTFFLNTTVEAKITYTPNTLIQNEI